MPDNRTPRKPEEIQVTNLTIEEAGEILRSQLPKINEEVRRIEESKRLSEEALNFRFEI